MFSASDVKTLREKTGAGMLDCKKALEENQGDMDKAIDWLREKGISKAAKKSDRIAAEGLAQIFVEGNRALVVEVNSETDFVAKNDEFKNLVNTIGNALISSDVSTIEEANEVSVDGTTIADLVVAATAKIGEKISFRRFKRIEKTDSQSFGSYIHMGGRIASLVLVDGDNADAAKDVAMHAAAMRPLYLNEASVPTEDLDKEKEIMRQELLNILLHNIYELYQLRCYQSYQLVFLHLEVLVS